jgi:hypothetical protein
MWAERQVHNAFIRKSLTGAREALYREVDTCRTAGTASMRLELWSIGSACEAEYFRHLRLGDIVRIYPADAETLPVRLKHNSRGSLTVLAEYFLQYQNHELHSGLVVIQKPNFGQ